MATTCRWQCFCTMLSAFAFCGIYDLLSHRLTVIKSTFEVCWSDGSHAEVSKGVAELAHCIACWFQASLAQTSALRNLKLKRLDEQQSSRPRLELAGGASGTKLYLGRICFIALVQVPSVCLCLRVLCLFCVVCGSFCACMPEVRSSNSSGQWRCYVACATCATSDRRGDAGAPKFQQKTVMAACQLDCTTC